MALSNDLISQFVKITQDKEQPKNEVTAYGKIVKDGDEEYVQLDGSDLLTPISSTTVVQDGDRVLVTIKNHTAIVTGDFTNPSANQKDVVEIGNKISEFEIVIADKVTTEQLEAEIAKIDKLIADEIDAVNGKFETIEAEVAKIEKIEADIVEVSGKVEAHEGEFVTLRADIATFQDVTVERIDAVEGNFNTLNSDYADFKVLTTNDLTAAKADIEELETKKLDTETANITYANIDFSNIGEAAIEKLFTDSGIIKDLIMSDGKVTGELVGVTIKGDLIEGNTIKADKLVILGSDGLYYKLNVDALGETTASSDEKYQNGLDGSVIIAESITAEKISVDDLVAFDATIGGFHITDHALYSNVKNTISNTTQGIFMSDDGQINIGDSNNYLKYYKGSDDKYYLEISAGTIKFSATNKTVEETISTAKSEAISTAASDATTKANNAKTEAINAAAADATSKANAAEANANSYTDDKIIVVNNTIVDRVAEIKVTTDAIEAEVGELTTTTENFIDETGTTLATQQTEINKISSIETKVDGITSSVSEITKTQLATDDAIDALNDNYETLTNTVSSKISSSDLQIEVQKQLANGVTSVTTTTGFTFNQDGLTVSKSGSEMSTTIDEDGMTVNQNGVARLVADNKGVTAYDLHAKTYLIIGINSRFQDYEKNGKKQTACFWIGDTEV